MGEPSDEGDNWSIEGHFEHGRFPTSSLEWTESDPSDWFKSEPFLECESRILSESDSARSASHGQSQEEDEKGRYPYSTFKFTSSSPPTSAATSSTFTTFTDTSTILHRVDDGARARSESDHSYSRDGKCVKLQGRDTGGGGTPSVWPGPITS